MQPEPCIHMIQAPLRKRITLTFVERKPNTAPTPATIPSKIKPFNQAAVPKDSNNPSIKLGIDGNC